MQRVEDIDVTFTIRNDHAPVGDKNKLPVWNGKFFTVGGPEGERCKAARQPFLNVVNCHDIGILAAIRPKVKTLAPKSVAPWSSPPTDQCLLETPIACESRQKPL